MTARPLDAAAVAERMNGRPLGPAVDGGEWYAVERGTLGVHDMCEVCQRRPFDVSPEGTSVACYPCAGEVLALCLPCAVKDCERAEADAETAAQVQP